MTGAYLRAKRQDGFEPIEVEHLTDEERHEQFINRDKEEILRWLNLVCEKLAYADSVLSNLVEEGVLERK